MPKQHSDVLLELIRSLTKAEKRHFKLYARRNASKADSLFIQLFEVIARRNKYDESVIVKAVPGIRRSQLPNLRSKLYREILVSLRLQYSGQETEIAVREMIDFAQLLYSKGLYRQSLNALDKAKSRAVEAHLHLLTLEITSFEKKIESQHITRSIDTRADELSLASAELAQIVAGETAFSNLSLKLYGLYLKMGHARSKHEEEFVKDFFVQNLPKYSEDDLSFFEKLYLYQSFVWLYQITQEFAKQYRYARKWVDLFSDAGPELQNNVPLYLKGMHNLLNALYLTFQYEKFNDGLAELESFADSFDLDLNDNESSLLTLFVYIHRLNVHFLDGSFSDGVTLAVELEEIVKSNYYNWDIHRLMVFNYKMACIHFGAGDNEKAIELLNEITNQVNPNLREDIQAFARILSLIAHFELGNDILVSYQIKSVYRFLLKMKELNATHKEILNFVRQTPKMQPSEVRQAFIALRKTLLEVQSHQFERRSGLYLDIISWLESKIQDRPVQDVIQEKFAEMAVRTPRS